MGFSLRTDNRFALTAGLLVALFSIFIAWIFRAGLPEALSSFGVFALLAILWIILAPLGARTCLWIAKHLPQEKFPFYRFVRYGIIGVLNVTLNLSIFNALIVGSGISQGLAVVFYSVIAYVVTVSHSFLWNKFVIFEHQESGAGEQYVRFFLVSGFTGILVTFFIHILVNVIGAPWGIDPHTWANIAVLAGIPISVLGNFAGYSIFVFKKKPTS